MRKRTLNIILIAVLAVLTVCTLAACDTGSQNTGLDGIDPNTSGGVNKTPSHLTFRFTEEPSSIFHYINIDDFNVADVKYIVNYSYIVNGKIFYEKGTETPLTLDMIDKNSREKLTLPGNHMIKASTVVDNRKVSGSFALHLKEADSRTPVQLTFNLEGGIASFGKADSDGKVKINVYTGSTFTWDEFIATFCVTKSGYALKGWTLENSQNFDSGSPAIGINNAMTFTAVWTADTINVSYNLQLPADAVAADPEIPPVTPESETVTANTGVLTRPEVGMFNCLTGYSFAGWFTDAQCSPEKLWNFKSTVGGEDMQLYAKWDKGYYDVTFNLLNGEFTDNLPSAPVKTNVENEVSYSKDTGLPTRIVFKNLEFGTKFSNYTSVIKLTASGSETVVVNLSQITPLLEKGEGNFAVDAWYTDNLYAQDTLFALNDTTEVKSAVTLYPKWKLTSTGEALNDYYVNYLFKDRLTILADGTVRIDWMNDATVSEVAIPESLTINGKTYIVSEIAERAFHNTQTLTLLDLSRATGLRSIGASAFEYCVALRTVIFPDEAVSSLQFIGDSAFIGSVWEEEYYQQTGEKFIIINDVLYKYVGNGETSVDIPEGVASIASGSFKKQNSIKTVNLSRSVKNIYNFAFENAGALEAIKVPEGAALSFIGENAFSSTEFILGKKGNISNQAIVIGSIYYRFVAPKSTSLKKAVIPDGITVIAPQAFTGYGSVSEIEFENNVNERIVSVGKDAFTETKWVQSEQSYPANAQNQRLTKVTADGFVIINGILANYMGSGTNVTVPGEVKSIVENAFGSTAHKVKAITLGTNVRSIDSKAFSGASSLEALKFEDLTTNALMNIKEDSFSDKDGKILEKIKIYLNTVPYNALIGENAAATYPVWARIYNANSEKFSQLEYVNARINPSIIPDKYFLENTQLDKIADKWKAMSEVRVSDSGDIANALIITSSDGSISTAPLNVSNVTGEYKAGNHTLTFTNGNIPCDPFAYSVYPAINGVALYDANDAEETTFELKDADAVKVTGLDKTYYTSSPDLDYSSIILDFKYINGNSGTIQIEEGMVGNFSRQEGKGKKLYITVDYHGFGQYRFSWTYDVEIVKEIKIEQTEGFSLPMGADSNQYLSQISLLLISNDGTRRYVPMSDKNIVIRKVDDKETSKLPTDILGYHRAEIQYIGSRGSVKAEMHYSVVLDAEPNLFTYHYNNNGEHKTAVITGIRATHSDVVVLPSSVKYGEDTYTVTEIGDNAFKNNVKIESIYIPETITKIGQYTFAGCINLKNVYSFENVAKRFSEINNPDKNYNIISETVEINSVVTIKSLKDVSGVTEITVPRSVKQIISSVGTNLMNEEFEKTTIYNYSFVLEQNAFGAYSGKIHLPDTEYFRTYAKDNLKDKTVEFYQGEGETDGNLVVRLFNIDEKSIKHLLTKKTGKVTLMPNAELVPLENGVVSVSNKWQDVSVDLENNTGTTELDYDVVGFEKGAFLGINSVATKLYLPNTFYIIGASASTEQTYPSIVYDPTLDNVIMSVSYSFPSKVFEIGKRAFEGCVKLTALELELAKVLTEIGEGAFAKTGLVDVDFKSTQVRILSDNIFLDCTALQYVVLSSATVEFGNGAFSGCTSLLNITNFGLLTYIGYSTFYNCVSLTKVDMPVTVKYIGDAAFAGCVNIAELIISIDPEMQYSLSAIGLSEYVKKIVVNHAAKIPAGFFENCKKLETLIFSKDSALVSVDKNAFRNCSSLKTLTLPSTLKTIGEGAFEGCKALPEIDLSAITSVGKNAFKGCASLRSLAIPQDLEIIGDGAFEDCDNLSDATFVVNPDGKYTVSSIGLAGSLVNAWFSQTSILPSLFFKDCGKLKEITLDSAVENIRAYAFENCGSLEKIYLSRVKIIGEGVFNGCTSLIEITVSKNNKVYESIDGVLYTHETPISENAEDPIPAVTTLVAYPAAKGSEYTVADATTVIGKNAFINSKLVTVNLPAGLTKIGEGAFKDNPNLTSVKFATDSLIKSIGADAFENCSELKSFSVPSTVETIGDNAFNGCSGMTAVYIDSKSVAQGMINQNAFGKLCAYTTNLYVGTDIAKDTFGDYLKSDFADENEVKTVDGKAYNVFIRKA